MLDYHRFPFSLIHIVQQEIRVDLILLRNGSNARVTLQHILQNSLKVK